MIQTQLFLFFDSTVAISHFNVFAFDKRGKQKYDVLRQAYLKNSTCNKRRDLNSIYLHAYHSFLFALTSCFTVLFCLSTELCSFWFLACLFLALIASVSETDQNVPELVASTEYFCKLNILLNCRVFSTFY